MKNYVNLIVFEDDTDLSMAMKILKANGFECEETTCYEAALKQEIHENLETNNKKVSLMNEKIILSSVEDRNEIWESLEQAVSEVVNNEINTLEVE